MPQSASIRNPPCATCKIASSVRTWNCTGPRAASKSDPEAREGCVLCSCSCRFRIRRRSG
eukprot:12608322-Alexandrium_andersonii.AAC.1